MNATLSGRRTICSSAALMPRWAEPGWEGASRRTAHPGSRRGSQILEAALRPERSRRSWRGERAHVRGCHPRRSSGLRTLWLHDRGGRGPRGRVLPAVPARAGGARRFAGPARVSRSERRVRTVCRSGRSSNTARSGSFSRRRSLFGTARIVNFSGWSLLPTSRQSSGVDTGAPGRGRTLRGATSRRPWPFWR